MMESLNRSDNRIRSDQRKFSGVVAHRTAGNGCRGGSKEAWGQQPNLHNVMGIYEICMSVAWNNIIMTYFNN